MKIPVSVAQLTGQMLMTGFEGTTLTPETKALIQKNHVGGVILFSRNYETPEQLYKLICDLQAAAAASPGKIPLFISVDQEGGRVARLTKPYTAFPPFCCLGNAASESLAYRYGKALATELRDTGINMDYAPVLDVHSNPANPIIGDRAISSDPQMVVRMAHAFIKAFDDTGVIPVGKHFPGHGDTAQDSHLELPTVDRDAATLEKVELVPFQKTIERGLGILMTAHVMYPAWDEKFPATFSRIILQNILRKKLGFKGVILSDDLEMKAVDTVGALEDLPRLGVEAGLDMFMVCNNVDKTRALHERMIQEVENGVIAKDTLVASVERILNLKKKFPTPPKATPDPRQWLKTHAILTRELQTHIKT